MRFLADESVDFPVIITLRDAGFDVDSIVELKPGIADEEVLNIAFQQKRILITVDKDFGDLSFRFQKEHVGIILYRLPDLKNIEKSKLLVELFIEYQDDFYSTFTVITSKNIRIRRI